MLLGWMESQQEANVNSGVATTAATQQKGGQQHHQSSYRWCDHVQEKFQVGDHTLLVTANTDLTYKVLSEFDNLVVPDFGVYLDGGWPNKLTVEAQPLPPYPTKPSSPPNPNVRVFGNMAEVQFDMAEILVEYQQELDAYNKALKEYDKKLAEYNKAKDLKDKGPKEYRWPFMLVDWPDRGIISVHLADRIVSYILKELAAGKVIDVGCAGAHGRTGTLLSMLLIDAEGLSPAEAIIEARKRHCKKIIESETQIRAIFGFGGLTATSKEVKALR